jgi:large subunit ribosomal protein L4
MRDHSFNIPKKLRLLALKTTLSAKLAEGNLIVIESEEQSSLKT